MIELKSSSSDGSSFRVYKNNLLIGYIHKSKGASGEKYQASIDKSGKEERADKNFDSPNDALRWIENFSQ